MIIIKKLTQDKWKYYRDLRLEALKNDPTAFGSSYEEEKKLTQKDWKKRMENTLFALQNDKPVGMIVFIFNNKIKSRHIAEIFGVYVKKEYRGQGIGSKLIESVLIIIQKNKKITKIKLTVNPDQVAAVGLYEKYGFVVAGRLNKEIMLEGNQYDELIMEKFL